MEEKAFIEVDYEIKRKIDSMINEKGLNVNNLLNKLITDSHMQEKKVNRLIEQNRLLKQRELDILDVADAVSDGIYISDRNGIVVAANKSYTKITGIRPDEIIGKNMHAVLDEKYLSNEYVVLQGKNFNKNGTENTEKDEELYIIEKPFAICKMVLEQKKEVSIVGTLNPMKDKKTVLFVGKPYFDKEGSISHVLIIMREIEDFAELKEKLQEAEKKSKLYLKELTYLRNNQIEDDLVVKDASMEKVVQLINHVAKTDVTVLITGETGVGKEVAAKEIYKKSNRSKQPYIKVNCAAIPENLLESEMFGYEKGAFTGAGKKEKLGYFEIAQGGTLLLDEIGELPIRLQSKLLRVLQERELTRIGGTKPIHLDVRVIAATNQNLEEQIKKGTFREDLYYRINVIPIQIPPLRDRKVDIAIFAHKFLQEFNEKYNVNKEFDITAIDILEHYEWPGNVRELKNSVERLVVIGDGRIIKAKDVLSVLGKNKSEFNLIDYDNMTIKDATELIERELIDKALKKYKSSRKAAKALGVTQPTVLRKAKALGIHEW